MVKKTGIEKIQLVLYIIGWLQFVVYMVLLFARVRFFPTWFYYVALGASITVIELSKGGRLGVLNFE